MGTQSGNVLTMTGLTVKLLAMIDALSVPDGGFSVDPVTGADVRSGYAAAVHTECERVLDHPVAVGDLIAYVARYADVLTLPGSVLGGWRDPETGKVYLDVSVVVSDYSIAVALAREAGQLAIFDFAAMESVRIEYGARVAA